MGKAITMMARGMKAAAAKAMTKGALAESLATSAELKKSVVTKLLGHLERLAPLRQRRLACSPSLALPGSRLAGNQQPKPPRGSCLAKKRSGKQSLPRLSSRHSQLLR